MHNSISCLQLDVQFFFVFKVLGLTKFVRPNNGSSPRLQPNLDNQLEILQVHFFVLYSILYFTAHASPPEIYTILRMADWTSITLYYIVEDRLFLFSYIVHTLLQSVNCPSYSLLQRETNSCLCWNQLVPPGPDRCQQGSGVPTTAYNRGEATHPTYMQVICYRLLWLWEELSTEMAQKSDIETRQRSPVGNRPSPGPFFFFFK